MTLKLPDEYSTGSNALDKDREPLALKLVTFASNLADKTFDNKDFQKSLGLKSKGLNFFSKSIDRKEKNRIVLELTIFNLFVISRWIMGNFRDNPKEVLDRMYYHFRKAMSDNDLEFGAITEERYMAYHESLSNQAGAGPMYWFGKTATQYVLGKEDVEPKILMLSTLFFPDLMLFVADSVKDFVTSGKYIEK